MRSIRLPDGTDIPALGQGTWMMGEGRRDRSEEVRALRTGLDLGMTLIDTAEIYGSGKTETLVAEAIEGRRDEVFLVSKVAPSHASREGTRRACEASLKRLGTDRLDLYLLHWRGAVPLAETIAAFEDLIDTGKILRWGVSNFDVEDMEELLAAPGGSACAANQVMYNLETRGVEFDLVGWLSEHGIAMMAYSPVGQGGAMLRDAALQRVAARHGASPAQIAVRFTTLRDGIVSVPKAGSVEHARENAASGDIALDATDLAALDAAFPPPRRKEPLAII